MGSVVEFPYETNEFKGKRVLVTGGTKGTWESYCQTVCPLWGTVITTARSIPVEGQVAELFIQADISTPEGVGKVVGEVLSRFGGLDILINNVGGSSAPAGGVLALSEEDWQHDFNANLFAAVRLDRGMLPSMLGKAQV
jgi:NAD(P)-dependent dehydrogenase (short-subunit alcohol dehydrogenase family)